MTEKKTDKKDVSAAVDDEHQKRWYVVKTYSGQENRVKENLEKRVESMGIQDSLFRIVVAEEPELVKETPMLHFETKRVQATGCVVADGFVVCKGSRIAPSIAKSCPENAAKCRRSNAEKIIDNVLQEDILLPSPSAAASFVSGSARNGNITWKTVEGTALGQLEDWMI